MTTLIAPAPAAKVTRLEIRNATYEARPIDPGFAGTAAVEVTKLVSGESYAVVLTEDGRTTCECPDYLCRRADLGQRCKHGEAALKAGLLVAPAPAPAFSPITAKDVARARMFGIKLPAAPMAEAPAVEVAPEIPATNPRDSWPAWTDSDRWTTEPAARGWTEDVGEWTVPAAEEVPALASDDEAACPLEGRRPARFAPSVEDEAYVLGYSLQLDHGIAADPPAEWRLMRSSAFRLGQADGLLARHRREDEEHAAWAEERERDAFGDPADLIHDAERCGVC